MSDDYDLRVMSKFASGKILAHRGIWSDSKSANHPEALTRALEMGFGIETDLRDRNCELVVSHDPPICWASSETVVYLTKDFLVEKNFDAN